MELSKIVGGIFAIIFSIILFLIIRYALKIMYKDVKNGTKKNKPQRRRPMDKNNTGNQMRTGATGMTNKANASDRLNRTGVSNRVNPDLRQQSGRQQPVRQQQRPQSGARPQQSRMQATAAQVRPTQVRQQRPMQQRPQGAPQRNVNRAPAVEVLTCRPGANIKIGSIIPVNRIITLGRKTDNLIVLNDNFASSYHAKLYLRNGEMILEDLNSTNGTFVNQMPIKGKVRLKLNDEIKLGETILRVIG